MKKFLAIILALAALLTLAACGSEGKGGARRDPNKVYLEDYLVFEEQGFDGKGQVSVRMDWDALIADNSQWLEKVLYDEADGCYFSYVDADGVTRRYFPSTHIPEDVLMSLVSGYFPKPSLSAEAGPDSLSNGDKITVNWQVDGTDVAFAQGVLGKELVFGDYQHTMSALTVIEKTDPFKFLNITYRDMVAKDGKNGYTLGTSAVTSVKLPNGQEVKIPVTVHITGEEFFTRQDTVHVSIEQSDVQRYLDAYGADYFTRLEADISLEIMAYLPVGSNAREIFDYLDEECLTNVANGTKKMAENLTGTEVTVELLGMMYYYDNEGKLVKNDDDRRYYNQLVMVYKLTDENCPEGWYTFMAYNGFVALGHGFSLETGEIFQLVGNIYGQHLHEDYRYYKNEHPKIWKYQPMAQTFACNGHNYPGHKTLAEMFQALDTNFMDKMDFDHMIVTAELAQYVKER